MGIIGVVAALTIPGLTANYQKRATVVQLKKFYAIMTNAIRASAEENDEPTGWDLTLTSKEFFERYLMNHLVISSVCDPEKKQKCTTIKTRKDLNGGTGALDMINAGRAYGAVLNNGLIIWLRAYDNKGPGMLVVVDLNGDSGPNRNGRDVFGFVFTQDGFHGYSHYGYNHKRRYDMAGAYGGCNKSACCSWMGSGGGCSTMIMYDNWQINPDYPWK